MRKADREGYCSVYMMDGNGRYLVTRNHYAPLLTAWKGGATFYEATDHFGAPVTIKLARVEAVSDCSAVMLAEAFEDDEQDRKERAIMGDE